MNKLNTNLASPILLIIMAISSKENVEKIIFSGYSITMSRMPVLKKSPPSVVVENLKEESIFTPPKQNLEISVVKKKEVVIPTTLSMDKPTAPLTKRRGRDKKPRKKYTKSANFNSEAKRKQLENARQRSLEKRAETTKLANEYREIKKAKGEVVKPLPPIPEQEVIPYDDDEELTTLTNELCGPIVPPTPTPAQFPNTAMGHFDYNRITDMVFGRFKDEFAKEAEEKKRKDEAERKRIEYERKIRDDERKKVMAQFDRYRPTRQSPLRTRRQLPHTNTEPSGGFKSKYGLGTGNGGVYGNFW